MLIDLSCHCQITSNWKVLLVAAAVVGHHSSGLCYHLTLFNYSSLLSLSLLGRVAFGLSFSSFFRSLLLPLELSMVV